MRGQFAKDLPFVRDGGSETQDYAGDSGFLNHFSQLSRKICFDSAIRIAQLFHQHHERFKTEHIFGTAIQHAEVATTVLLAAAADAKDPGERESLLQHLRVLDRAMKALTLSYQPAERMLLVLQQVCREVGWDLSTLQSPEK